MQFSVTFIILAGALAVPTLSAPAVVIQDNRSITPQVALFPSSPVMAPAVVRRSGSQSAVVSTQIKNQKTSQSLAVGDGPIVAILPAGSNLSATWDLSSKAQPTIGLSSSFLSSTLPSVIETESSMAIPDSTELISNVSGLNVPVILPVGIADSADRTAVGTQAIVPIVQAVGLNNSVIGHVNGDGVVVEQNHRIEIQLMDFQMNNSANSEINQNIAIFAKVSTAVLVQPTTVLQSFSLADATPVLLRQPSLMTAAQTTTGMQQVFNGTYRTSLNNKVAVLRTITQDLCGQINDKAFLNVVIAPLTTADGANFQQQSYTCVIDISFLTASRISESFWSDIMQCNSGNLNRFTFRLWYKVRQYNINTNICQQIRPNPVSMS